MRSIKEAKTLGDNEKCWYCGVVGETTKDHFMPKSKGGRLGVRACRYCNQLKANRTPLQWIIFLEKLKRSPNDKSTIYYTIPVLDRMITATKSLMENLSEFHLTNDKFEIEKIKEAFLKLDSKSRKTIMKYLIEAYEYVLYK